MPNEHRIGKTILALIAASALSLTVCLHAQAITETEKSWARIQQSGSDNLDANKYWLAEPQLKEALQIAEASGFKDMRLARANGEMGRYYTVRGLFSKAEPYLEKELSIKEQVLNPQEGKIVPAMGSLIVFYVNYGTARKAEPLTEDMLALIDGKLSEPLDRSNSGTKVKYKRGKTLEAWAGQAAQVAIDPLLEWAITCDNVGNTYAAHGNWQMADRLFKASLDLKATILGQGHLSLANTYDSLGSVCLEQKEYPQAAIYLSNALEITEKIQPLDSPDVYSRLDKLARIYIKAGKYKEAEDLYIQAQNFWKKAPSRRGDEARALFALGSLYTEEKKYASAAPLLLRALHMSEAFNGTSSIQLVPYLQRLAYTEYYLGRRGSSEALAARASTIAPREKNVEPMVATAEMSKATADSKDPRADPPDKSRVSRKRGHGRSKLSGSRNGTHNGHSRHHGSGSHRRKH